MPRWWWPACGSPTSGREVDPLDGSVRRRLLGHRPLPRRRGRPRARPPDLRGVVGPAAGRRRRAGGRRAGAPAGGRRSGASVLRVPLAAPRPSSTGTHGELGEDEHELARTIVAALGPFGPPVAGAVRRPFGRPGHRGPPRLPGPRAGCGPGAGAGGPRGDRGPRRPPRRAVGRAPARRRMARAAPGAGAGGLLGGGGRCPAATGITGRCPGHRGDGRPGGRVVRGDGAGTGRARSRWVRPGPSPPGPGCSRPRRATIPGCGCWP